MTSSNALRFLAVVATMLVHGVLATASAQSYPSRPIRFIHIAPAGTSSDVVWRLVNQEVGRRLAQTIVFENRAGAGGRVAVDQTIKSAKDGYTVGLVSNGVAVVQPLIDSSFRLEAVKDYTPIVPGIANYFVLVAQPSLRFSDMNGLISYAKANPGKLSIGTAGAATPPHLAQALLNSLAGIDTLNVNYNGTAPLVTAMLAGNIELSFIDSSAKQHVDAGKFKAIATTGPKRWVLFPSVQTLNETAALKELQASSWTAVIGPAGLPAEMVGTLNRAYNDAFNAPEVRARLDGLGYITLGGTAEDVVKAVRAETELVRPAVRAAKIKVN